jgi:hypothetical protein
MRAERWILVELMAFDAVALLGQIWPEAAPPFARWVNVAFLVASLAYFARALMRRAT